MNRSKRVAEARAKARAKEIEANNLRYIWMSFSDPGMPTGEQFIGVIITKAYGPADAMSKTHDLHINPGGAFESYACSLEYGKRYEGNTDRLLSKAQLEELDYI